MKPLNERTVCPDGFSVSIQANQFAYCLPRRDKGPYTHVELGYPTHNPPDYLMEYCEDDENPTNTVYGYVPIELVERWLKEHGLEKMEPLS